MLSNITTFIFMLLSALAAAEQPWWTNTLGTAVTDFDQFKKLLTEEAVDKVVVADFYMRDCYWCQQF